MEAAKRKLDKEMEQIDAMGQDGKAGIKATQEIMKEEEKKEKEVKGIRLERLKKQSSRGTFHSYNYLMANLLNKIMFENTFPAGWSYQVAPTEEGVILELTSPDKRYFRNAFKPTGEPKYDLNAIETYVVRAQNTVDRIQGEWTKQKEKTSLSSKS